MRMTDKELKRYIIQQSFIDYDFDYKLSHWLGNDKLRMFLNYENTERRFYILNEQYKIIQYGNEFTFDKYSGMYGVKENNNTWYSFFTKDGNKIPNKFKLLWTTDRLEGRENEFIGAKNDVNGNSMYYLITPEEVIKIK
jgi:hypothetical protein